jgi:serine/threonine protein kinase
MAKSPKKTSVEKLIAKELNGATGSLANYTIEKKIGQGQFSTVYKAKANADGRITAVKRVPVRKS